MSPVKVGSFLFKSAKVMFDRRSSKRPKPIPAARVPAKPWLEPPATPYPDSHQGMAKSPAASILWMRARLQGMRQNAPSQNEVIAIRTELESLAQFFEIVEAGPPPYDLDNEPELVQAAKNYLIRTAEDNAAQIQVVPFLELISRENPELRGAIFAAAPQLGKIATLGSIGIRGRRVE